VSFAVVAANLQLYSYNSEMVQASVKVTINMSMKSYMIYQLVSFLMILSDP